MLLYCKHATERNAKYFFTVEKDGNMHNYRRRQGKRALTIEKQSDFINSRKAQNKVHCCGLQLPFFTTLTIFLWPEEDSPSPVWNSEVSPVLTVKSAGGPRIETIPSFVLP